MTKEIPIHFTDEMSHEDRSSFLTASLELIANNCAKRLAIIEPKLTEYLKREIDDDEDTDVDAPKPVTDEGDFLYTLISFIFRTYRVAGVVLEGINEDEFNDEENSD